MMRLFIWTKIFGAKFARLAKERGDFRVLGFTIGNVAIGLVYWPRGRK